jgi:hypothetical protein
MLDDRDHRLPSDVADCESAAQFVDVSHKLWSAYDSTEMSVQDRIKQLRDVKRYFLQGITDWMTVPSHVHGLTRASWVQVLQSVDTQITTLDPHFAVSMGAPYIHPRNHSQDACECLFSTMTQHRTVDLFESRLAWAALEFTKICNSNTGFYKRVSARKSRIADIDATKNNPFIVDGQDGGQDAGWVQHKRKKRSEQDMGRALADPRRRGDRGKIRNNCREKYARVKVLCRIISGVWCMTSTRRRIRWDNQFCNTRPVIVL